MDFIRILLLSLALNIVTLPTTILADKAPHLLLAKQYHEAIEPSEYWVSEKLDGVRAYWDGSKLLSKSGRVFAAPEWFTQKLPALPLDGELWIARNSFAETISVVNKQTADDNAWKKIKYMLFDAPDTQLDFSQRLQNLKQLVTKVNAEWIQMIPQQRVQTHESLMQLLETTVTAGGEGLMLHHQKAKHRSGRSNNLLKLKKFEDAEAQVIAHLPGKGRFSGMLGALLVVDATGQQFRIGSGFSAKERREPPPLGAQITYRYSGYTRNGLPRFPVFLRERPVE